MRVVFVLFMFLLFLVIAMSFISNSNLGDSGIKDIMKKRNQQIQELLNQ